jgi:hypothetical protein
LPPVVADGEGVGSMADDDRDEAIVEERIAGKSARAIAKQHHSRRACRAS